MREEAEEGLKAEEEEEGDAQPDESEHVMRLSAPLARHPHALDFIALTSDAPRPSVPILAPARRGSTPAQTPPPQTLPQAH